ncbi:hypothetical protein U1Q18_049340 [Sarracenia purpurea var. burkii]
MPAMLYLASMYYPASKILQISLIFPHPPLYSSTSKRPFSKLETVLRHSCGNNSGHGDGMLAGFPAFIMFQLQKEMEMTMDEVSWLGGSLPVASTYIAEISRAQYRGSLLAMVWLMGIFGTAFVYILEFSFTWRGVVLIIVGLSALGLTQLQVVPETRFFYLLRKRKEDALESTAWFENTKVAQKETEIIHSLMSFGKNFGDEDDLDTGIISIKALKRLQVKPLLLSLSVVILRCGTGKVLFTVYPIQLFTALGTPYDGKILGICFGLCNFASIVLNMLLFSTIDRFKPDQQRFTFTRSLRGILVRVFDSRGHRQEQKLRLIDETNDGEETPLVPSIVNPMQPVIPEEVFDTMKNSFNAFMENNPLMSKNPVWKSNKNMIIQQQEWLKNTWMKAAQAGKQPKRSRSPKAGSSSNAPLNPNGDHEV